LFVAFGVDELVVDEVLLVGLFPGVADGLAGADEAGVDDGAGESFFSPSAAGAFSPSDGGFSLFE